MCAADICVRIRAAPMGTTGYENATAKTPWPTSAVREPRRLLRVADHHRDDRVLARQDVEAELGHPPTELARVRREALAEVVGALDQIERLEARTDDRRREAVREEVRASALAEQLDDLPAPRDVPAARAADGLAERAREDVDPRRRRRAVRASRARRARRSRPRASRRPERARRGGRRARRSRRASRGSRPSRRRRRSRRADAGHPRSLRAAPRAPPCRRSRTAPAAPCRVGSRR